MQKALDKIKKKCYNVKVIYFADGEFSAVLLRSEDMLKKEGETRIPAGCAISGFINRSGRRTSGKVIVDSIGCMHERSNGLGGGFAGYGIYPEYKNQYAFHVFYDSS